MIAVFILIALAMTVPALAGEKHYTEPVYQNWNSEELKEKKIDQLKREKAKQKLWQEKQAAREEYLRSIESVEAQKEREREEYLAELDKKKNDRAPASEIANDKAERRKQRWLAYVEKERYRRRYIKELRRHQDILDKFDQSKINQKIEILEKENERD